MSKKQQKSRIVTLSAIRAVVGNSEDRLARTVHGAFQKVEERLDHVDRRLDEMGVKLDRFERIILGDYNALCFIT